MDHRSRPYQEWGAVLLRHRWRYRGGLGYARVPEGAHRARPFRRRVRINKARAPKLSDKSQSINIAGVSAGVVEFLFRREGVNRAVKNLERYAVEELAAGARRSRDTFAARRVVIGVVRLAHQVAPLLGEELVVDPIHRHRHVTASVDVGVEMAVVIDHEAFLVDAANRQHELHRLAGREVGGATDAIADFCGLAASMRMRACQRVAAIGFTSHANSSVP